MHARERHSYFQAVNVSNPVGCSETVNLPLKEEHLLDSAEPTVGAIQSVPCQTSLAVNSIGVRTEIHQVCA
jgi:hypothetical protein